MTWFITLIACVGSDTSQLEINGVRPFQLYFASLPDWLLAAILCVGISCFYQNEIARAN